MDDEVIGLFLKYCRLGNVIDLEHEIEEAINTIVNDKISLNSLILYLSNKKVNKDEFLVE